MWLKKTKLMPFLAFTDWACSDCDFVLSFDVIGQN